MYGRFWRVVVGRGSLARPHLLLGSFVGHLCRRDGGGPLLVFPNCKSQIKNRKSIPSLKARFAIESKDLAEKDFSDNETNARTGAAMARMLPVGRQVVPIVESDFFSCGNFAESNNPNMAVYELSFAVRIAGMIDPAREVAFIIPIEIRLGIQREDVLIVCLTSF